MTVRHLRRGTLGWHIARKTAERRHVADAEGVAADVYDTKELCCQRYLEVPSLIPSALRATLSLPYCVPSTDRLLLCRLIP